MSSNKQKKKDSPERAQRKKIRNEKLYKRITLSFSAFNLSISAGSLLLALIISSFVMTSWQKNNFADFSEEIYSAIINESYRVSQLAAENRAKEYFNSCVMPLSDKKMEVGVAIIDSYGQHSNVYSYSKLIPPLIKQFDLHTHSYDESRDVQRFKFERRRYLFMSTELSIEGLVYTVITFQDDSETTSYILWLSCVIIGAFCVITILILLFGKLVTRRALAPLKGIAESVKTISEENLTMRLSAQGEDEVDSLIVALNNMLTRLNNAFEMQKQFVSDVSHEMRIPLTILQGNLDIIETWGKSDPDVMRESLASMSEEIQNMRDLIEQLLFLHNVSAGNYSFSPQPSDLNIMAEKLAQDTKTLTLEHNIEMKLSDKPVNAMVDRTLLAFSLRAVIDNAIKYTEAGGTITLSTAIEKNKVVFTITDTGCGISEADLDNVLERFYRVDSARSKHTGGSGLGLAIVKANVEAMGGELKIKSTQGVGTSVSIRLARYYGEENERSKR